MRKSKNNLKGFTLVELIVVIMILAIISTIALVSFRGYVSSARDSNRLATISDIQKGLDSYSITTGRYPDPDNYGTVLTGGINSYIKQGEIGKSVTKFIGMNEVPLDPLDRSRYTYSIFGEGEYYQVAINKEKATSNIISNVYVEDKSVIVKGDYEFDPSLPSLILVKSSVGAPNGIFSPEVCFVMNGWKNTLTSSSGSCIRKKDMNLNDFDSSLAGYWDMETTVNIGGLNYLRDLSGRGNNGVFSGGMVYENSLTGGMVGKALNFNGNDYLYIKKAIDKYWIEANGKDHQGINFSLIIKPKYSAEDRIRHEYIFSNGSGESGTGSIFLRSRTCCERDIIFYMKKANVNSYDPDGEIRYKGRGVEWNYNNLLSTNYYKLSMNLDPTRGVFNMYSNGKMVASGKMKEGMYKNPSDLYIGNIIPNADNGFMGIIDEFRIYYRALTDEEIRYQARIAGF